MQTKDRRYLEIRAREELERARAAASPIAGRAHYQLFELYLKLLFPLEGSSIVPAQKSSAKPANRDHIVLASTHESVLGQPSQPSVRPILRLVTA